MTIKFLFDKISLKHNPGSDHPENSERLVNIIQYFNKKSINLEKAVVDEDKTLTLIRKIHSENDIVNRVINSAKSKFTYFDQDTIANNHTAKAALTGASLAVNAAINSEKDSYFSIIRPPGHHATPNRMMGFCFYNNIAVAAKALLEKKEKVAIFDFDFHYGNGTADIFWNNPNVLYISTHADPSINFPNQGFLDEIGGGDGKGTNICIPLQFYSGNNEIISAIKTIVLPILAEFKPTIIGVSAGFDSYFDDPVGDGFLQFSDKGFNFIGQLLYNFSKENKIPLFHVLEGGYNTEMLPKLIEQYIYPWKTNHYDEDKFIKSTSNLRIQSAEKKNFQYIKQMVGQYWNLS